MDGWVPEGFEPPISPRSPRPKGSELNHFSKAPLSEDAVLVENGDCNLPTYAVLLARRSALDTMSTSGHVSRTFPSTYVGG